ncbi:MAG: GntG family PLP-dependent aldolase [Alphaproteobacteria bacterium]|nr:GntG family PLP-dependent aldolase [Alphaproteobacteria bacterium]MDP6815242.1 GntG family PLP-dependent aldolase [Alphaproteobacteria bacterium]
MIDLRSDFVARPTPEMVAAMARAAELPGGFGPREDATVARLERLAADTLGLADALFCPTCTMANQIAIHLRCRPGEAFVTEAEAHVVTSESAAPAALSGAMPKLVPAKGGALAIAAVEAALTGADAQRARVGLVVMENTHVRSGGTVLGLEHMAAIAELARVAGVPVHLDGARLFNAACALGVAAAELAACADSVACNLNKGLGAPLGAILAGPADFIAEAVRIRQMFGGGWRPAGIPAAAGIVALESMVDRLADDHARARALADGLAALDGIDIDPETVESNIVLARPRGLTPDALAEALAGEGILALPFGPFLRLVSHHEIDDDAVEETLAAFRAVLSGEAP